MHGLLRKIVNLTSSRTPHTRVGLAIKTGILILDRDTNGYADPLLAFHLALASNLDRDANGYAGLCCASEIDD